MLDEATIHDMLAYLHGWRRDYSGQEELYMAQRQPQAISVTQRYGLALMRVWIAQNRLADPTQYGNRRDEETEFQAALAAYRVAADQAPWWAIAHIHSGLQVRVTPDGHVLSGITGLS